MKAFKARRLFMCVLIGIFVNASNAQTVDIGTPSMNSGLRIFGRDSIHYYMPLMITGNIQGQTFGFNPGQTQGRLVRFNQGPSVANGGINFYDLFIGQDTSFYISNHSVPPTVGNYMLRKRMFVISTDDRVGTNLAPGQKPTASFHSVGTVRHEGLPTTTESLNKVVMTDDAGNIFWKNASTMSGSSNAWKLTGNSGTDSSLSFIGTTDNSDVVFKANGAERMKIHSGSTRGIDIGTVDLNNELRIFGRDSIHYTIPLLITGNIMGQTFGFSPGQTQGRLLRFNQGPSVANGGINFYDFFIGQDTSFYISNHSVPPTVGNYILRKRMFVISTDDKVGINLPPSAKPTANLHSEGTVRFENLPSGGGNVLVVDDNGNVFKSSAVESRQVISNAVEIEKLKKEIRDLKAQLEALTSVIKSLNNGSTR
jgi:hypothetical protein